MCLLVGTWTWPCHLTCGSRWGSGDSAASCPALRMGRGLLWPPEVQGKLCQVREQMVLSQEQQDGVGQGTDIAEDENPFASISLTGLTVVTYATEALEQCLMVLRAIIFYFLVIHMHKI